MVSFHFYFQSIHLSKCSQSSIKNDYSVALLSASSVLEYFMKNTSLFSLLFHWIKHFCSAPIVWRQRCVEIRSLCYPFLWTIKQLELPIHAYYHRRYPVNFLEKKKIKERNKIQCQGFATCIFLTNNPEIKLNSV